MDTKVKEIDKKQKNGERTCHSMGEALAFISYLNSQPEVNDKFYTYFGPKCHVIRWSLK